MNEKEIKERRKAQNKMLSKMKKEITSLEYMINHPKTTNMKIKTIKDLKISARFLQMIMPYTLTASIVAGIFSFAGNTPFCLDERKAYLNTKKEFDNNGNISCEEQYETFEDSTSRLYYYSKWEDNNDGTYSRITQTYKINDMAYENILELFGQENIRLEDILGKPISSIKLTKNNLTQEEIEEEPLIKAEIYNVDTNSYIFAKETIRDNIAGTILYILAALLAEFIPKYYRDKYSNFDFEECVRRIKEEYQPVDIDILTKKLEIKKDNYNRLLG